MPSIPFPTATSTALTGFTRELVGALEKGVPKGIRGVDGEKALKQLFIVEQARVIRRTYPDLRVFSPPWGSEALCATHLEEAGKKGVPAETGCPQCWKESKSWVSTDAWGMRHNFDLAVRDTRSGEALVLEVKMFTRDKSPNEEIQRFLGQLLLARSKHPIVLGVCGWLKNANMGLFKDTDKVRNWCRNLGLGMVFVSVPSATQ